MHRLIVAAFISAWMLSCNYPSNGDTKADTLSSNPPVTEPDEDLSGCYMGVLQRDTLAASLTQKGKRVTGKLTFDNYQKDGSSGTVNGVLEGDILKLVYRFESEGMKSTSEVYFRVVPGGLLHGTGQVAVKGDSAFYSSPTTLSYDGKEKLVKIPCDVFPAKLK